MQSDVKTNKIQAQELKSVNKRNLCLKDESRTKWRNYAKLMQIKFENQ